MTINVPSNNLPVLRTIYEDFDFDNIKISLLGGLLVGLSYHESCDNNGLPTITKMVKNVAKSLAITALAYCILSKIGLYIVE